MSPVRFTFVLPSGVSVTGPVRGCGGMVGAPRLRKAQRIAAQGRPHGLYEPAPGHVAVYPDHSAADDGGSIAVPLSALVGVAPSLLPVEVDAVLDCLLGDEIARVAS